MKIVINKCYGGFSLSPEATLELYKSGYTDELFAISVDEYFSSDFRKQEALNQWKKYKQDGSGFFLTIFSDDEKFVLDERPENRSHPKLIEIVEKMREKANGPCAKLKIIEIPDGIEWSIEEYDGVESIHEKHRIWG